MHESLLVYRLALLTLYMGAFAAWTYLWMLSMVRHQFWRIGRLRVHRGLPALGGLLIVMGCAVADFLNLVGRGALLSLLACGVLLPGVLAVLRR